MAINFPSTPSDGQIETFDNIKYIYVASKGVWNILPQNPAMVVADTEPENPTDGELWFNSANARMYAYYDGFWVETSSNESGPTGVVNAISPITYDSGSKAVGINQSAIAINTSNITDFDINTPISGDIMVYNGTNWENKSGDPMPNILMMMGA
jgi:hypothetical protein